MGIIEALRTIFEIALVLFAIWAVFNEDLFIAIEERIISSVKRKRLKVITGASYRAYK